MTRMPNPSDWGFYWYGRYCTVQYGGIRTMSGGEVGAEVRCCTVSFQSSESALLCIDGPI
jgi:hypothetical protein